MGDIVYKFKKILVLYVGGTIGMKKDEFNVYIPKPNMLFNKIKVQSELHDPKLATKLGIELEHDELILPNINNNAVVYKVKEYNPLLDSSNMSSKDWIRIAKDIEKNYEKFNGFLVLHGTDTMAYTSSALSFMLRGLQKPVIVTGSQIPIYETRSDAKDNVLSSLILASCYEIHEVCVFFSNKLLRGNRTSKLSSSELDAFNSPNYHTLADVGINISVHEHYILKNDRSNNNLEVNTNLNPHVGMLCFFPTITKHMIDAFLQPPIVGVVLQSYGVGNIPSKQTDILKVFKKAVDRGVLIVNVTQCPQGSVTAAYETGKALENLGIISGKDMTAEAALTKLSFILGLPGLTYVDQVKLLKTDLRGELSNVFY